MPRPDRPTVLGYELLVYHLESGSSVWINGTCIGRMAKVKDKYRLESGVLIPLDEALEVLVRAYSAESEVERV